MQLLDPAESGDLGVAAELASSSLAAEEMLSFLKTNSPAAAQRLLSTSQPCGTAIHVKTIHKNVFAPQIDRLSLDRFQYLQFHDFAKADLFLGL